MLNRTAGASYLAKRFKAMASKLASWRTFRSRPKLSQIYPILSQAFSTPLGQVLRESETRAISSLLEEYRGSKVLHVSICGQLSVNSPSPFRCVIHAVSGVHEEKTSDRQTICDFHALPFDTEQFDLVIIQHVLEFSENPQGALKEAARVTKASGHLVLIAFNPASPSGVISALFGRFKKLSLWDRRYLFAYRLQDWLSFVDFTLIERQALCHVVPLNAEALVNFNRRFSSLMEKFKVPVASVVCMVARKDKLGMNLSDKKWIHMPVRRALFSPSPAITPSATPKVGSAKVLSLVNK